MNYSRILSADVQIADNPGFAVIEIFDNGTIIFIERYYPTLSDLEVDINLESEEIINTYPDTGEYYDSIPKMERISK
jgi:hypothetical protein